MKRREVESIQNDNDDDDDGGWMDGWKCGFDMEMRGADWVFLSPLPPLLGKKERKKRKR